MDVRPGVPAKAPGLFLSDAMNEYPKCLYLGGDVTQEHCVVFDAGQEQIKREVGFCMAGEEKAPPAPTEEAKPAARKPGRPRKAD